MTAANRRTARHKRSSIRCGIYCRKSTNENLDNDFNSLDAQREACEAYIASQRHEGWVCLEEHYDDPALSAATMDRPGLRRLLTDVERGKVNCAVVYKVDRLSRSLYDFAQIMRTLEKHGASFVSVTQAFNSATSSGRLVMNVLLSFSEFERQLISERTADKMGGAKRRGKWVGGYPPLGFDVADQGGRLIVNEEEAERVRAIFDLYIESGSLRQTVRELNRRGWRAKEWTTKGGKRHGGGPLHKSLLGRLIGNPLYLGRVHYRGATYPGEHEAIVDVETWERAQELMRRGEIVGGWNETSGLLKGLLRCGACDALMVSTYSKGRNGHRYRYYVCQSAQRNGWRTCPVPSLPAAEIEQFVVERIKAVGSDAKLRGQLVRKVRAEFRNGSAGREGGRFDGKKVAAALADLAASWDDLPPREQRRVITVLVERVEHHAGREVVAVTFRPSGIADLAGEAA